MYSSCLCRHIYNNFLFYVFSKILALVSYAKIREEIKFMCVCMYVCDVSLIYQREIARTKHDIRRLSFALLLHSTVYTLYVKTCHYFYLSIVSHS